MPLADMRECRTEAFRGFGAIPWWSWNGDMEYGEVRRQLELMKDAGVEGWMLFPRFGLEMPYLGHEYMTKVRFAVEESARLGLEVWIYDEYAWPSGNAQCQVGEVDPEYRWRVLSAFTFEIEGGREHHLKPEWGATGHVRKAAKMSGETPHSDQVQTSDEIPISYLQQSRDPEGNRLFLNPRIERVVAVPLRNGQAEVVDALCIDSAIEDLTVRWTPPPGSWRVQILISRDYGILIDHLNPEAVRTFMRLTHDKYTRSIGEYYGNTVAGFFSDETRMFRDTSHRFLEPTIVWTKDLFGRLRDAGLTDLDAAMAAVFDEGDSPAMRRLRLAFWDRVTDLYAGAYYQAMADWAEDHGVTYTGDFFSEDRSVVPYLGDYFKCIRPYQMPGFDSLGLCNPKNKEDYKSPKFASSAAHMRGESTRCFAEGPGLLSWSVTLEELRRTGDWLYVLGANRLIPNSFLYTLNHESLYVSPSYFFQWTMWQHFPDWEGYLRRLGYVLTRGTHVAPVALLYPTESLLSGFRPVIPAGGRPWQSNPETERRYQDAVNTAYGLLCRQIDFDYIDAAYLGSRDLTAGAIPIGGERARVLVLAGHSLLRRETAEAVRTFVENGGHAVWVGAIATLDEDGRTLDDFDQFLAGHERCAVVDSGVDQEALEERLTAALDRFMERPVRITGPLSRRCLVNMRRDGDDAYLFIATHSEEAHAADLDAAGWDGMERCDLLTGEWHPTEAAGGRLRLSFAPHESVLLRKSPPRTLPNETGLRLGDNWELEIPDLNLHVPGSVRTETAWRSRAGWEAMLLHRTAFEATLEAPLPECRLILEDAEHLRRLRRLKVVVNGAECAVRAGTAVDPQIVEADLTAALRTGANEIVIEYTHTDYDNCENLFAKRRSPAPQLRPRLLGRFLATDGVLRPCPGRLPGIPSGDLVPLGLGFYSGRAIYRQTFTLDAPVTISGLVIEELKHQAIVRIDGNEAGRILWRPFRCYGERQLAAGPHTLELEITNTQGNRMFEDAKPFGLMGAVRLMVRS